MIRHCMYRQKKNYTRIDFLVSSLYVLCSVAQNIPLRTGSVGTVTTIGTDGRPVCSGVLAQFALRSSATNKYQQAIPVEKDSLTHIGFWWSTLSFNNGGNGTINRPLSKSCKFFIRYQ